MKTWRSWSASRAEYLVALLKTRVRKPSVKPCVEVLEDRFLPSASPTNPPQTSAPLVGATTSPVAAMETFVATLQQDERQMLTTLIRDVQTLESVWLVYAAATNPLFASWLHDLGGSSNSLQTSGSGALSTASAASSTPSTSNGTNSGSRISSVNIDPQDSPQDEEANCVLFATPGTWDWTAPEGVTQVTAYMWGAGGGGGGYGSGGISGAGGGGGGGFLEATYNLVPGTCYSVTVGAGGAGGGTSGSNSGVAGGDSYFGTNAANGRALGGGGVVVTMGGTGGGTTGALGGGAIMPSGGLYVGSGALSYTGGQGGNGGTSSDGFESGGGGGGGGGGPTSDGSNGVVGGSTGGAGGAGGGTVSWQTSGGDVAVTTGNGGQGGAPNPDGLSGSGLPGQVPGGGGGGTGYGEGYNTGGNGADGEVVISWVTNVTTPITVNNPGNQSNAEGDSVSLQIQASDSNGTPLFGASNLPPGLTIDSSTGLISGTINYGDAQTQGGQYSVTVTATDSIGDTGSTTFNWTVSQTVTLPTLDNPGDMTNWQGDSVALQLSASDADGDALTYSATGLPNGLSLNPTTGLISGVLAAPDGASSPYNVTVSVSDANNNTASQSFTWTVATVQVDPVADQTNLIGDSVSVPINAFDQSGQALSYSATGLPPGLSIDASTGLIIGTIADNASVTTPYNVTVTASDGADPASTTFAWNVSNFSLDNPGDQTNVEGDAVALQPTVETNGNPTLTFSATGLPYGLSINPNSGLIAGTIANLDSNNSPYTVTISATDGTSISSQSFTWTVTYIVFSDPGDQINAPGDTVSLSVPASDPANDALTYTATGLPTGLSINASTGLISGTIASTAGSDTPYSVTVTASDGTHTASDTFNWTVANQAVTVTNPGTQSNAEGDNVSLQIDANDPSGNAVGYTATGLPDGLSIDPNSGLISGTIDSGDAETNNGVYQVTVLADDGQGNNGITTFTWNISATNLAPTLYNPGDQVDQAGDVVSLPLFAYDDDGDTVTYSATGLPSGLSLDANSGIISGTLAASAASSTPYSVTVTAYDGTLTAQQTFNWFVTAGVVTLTSPGDQTNTEGDSVSLQLSASDANNSTLTYQASGLPSGLSINSSGLISGTVASGDAADGPYLVTVMASDGQGNSSAQQFLWNVNAANLDPVVTNPGSQINTQSDVLELQIEATDPAGNGLSYTATGLPPGLTINSSSGLISGVLSSSSASDSPYSVTVTATDGDYSGSTTFSWSVTNQAVTVTNPGTQSNSGNDSVSLQIDASDPDGDFLEYTASGLPIGLMIDPMSGLISGTVDYSAAEISGGQYNVTVTVNDGNGDTANQSFVWTIANTPQAPWLEPVDFQNNQTGTSASLQLVAGSPDGNALTYSASGLPSGLSVDPNTGLISGTTTAAMGSYTVTATVTDNGNNLSDSQTFTWQVTCGPAPQVLLSFEGQPAGEDFVAEVDPDTPIPVLVTLENATQGMHNIQISIPSGEAEVNVPSFQLPNGGSKTITLTPEQVSQAFDDVDVLAFADGKEAGEGKGTDEKITIGHIRATDTPALMSDRIPPRVTTVISVKISTKLGDDKKILFKVLGQSNANGTIAGVLGDEGLILNNNITTLNVTGNSQTAPGNAGKLQIVAYAYNTKTKQTLGKLGTSAGFSVAAIPIEVDMRGPEQPKGEHKANFWGAVYPFYLVSDSGVRGDLNDIQVSEYAQYVIHTGIWQKVVDPSLAWVKGSTVQYDRNGTFAFPQKRGQTSAQALQEKIDASLAQGQRSATILAQVFVFSDARTGVPANWNAQGAMTINQSGYVIFCNAVKKKGTYSINVRRYAIAEMTVTPTIVTSRAVGIGKPPTTLPARGALAGGGTGSDGEELQNIIN